MQEQATSSALVVPIRSLGPGHRARIQAHWDAGADHVCIQPFTSDGEMGPDERLLALLAPAHG